MLVALSLLVACGGDSKEKQSDQRTNQSATGIAMIGQGTPAQVSSDFFERGRIVDRETIRNAIPLLTTPTPSSIAGRTATATPAPGKPTLGVPATGICSQAYPTVCIPPPPPDLDCADIQYKRFKVLPPDPHRFDADRDGIGCER